MKNRIALGCALFLFVLVVDAKPKNSTKFVSVEVELEEIPNVETYEIEVKKTSEKKEIFLNFSQKESNFKIKLIVGNYLVRTRIITKQADTGPWSEWSELLARPEEVNLEEMSNYNISVHKNQNITDVELKWDRANGADKYIVWVEDLVNKTTVQKKTITNNSRLNLKLGEYKIGVQSVSKDGIKSDIKYFDNSFYVARTQLPEIKLERLDINNFKWIKQRESEVKIEIYRKAFFGDKYVKIDSLVIDGESWFLPKGLQPGEYRINFQYISESFENGPVQSVSYLKKPGEKDFQSISK